MKQKFWIAKDKTGGYFWERDTGWGHVGDRTSNIMEADQFETKDQMIYALVERGEKLKEFKPVAVRLTVKTLRKSWQSSDLAEEKRIHES